MPVTSSPVTAEHIRQFQQDGFFILPGILSPHDLQALRDECQRAITEREAEMDRLGVDRLDLDHRGRRYFVHAYQHSEIVRRFLFSDLMTEIARATLGETVYLFNEQYVVKAAEQGMTFSWHQDSGFIGYPHAPYLSCWITLDDVTEANGTVYLLPFSQAGTRDVVPHVRDERTNDMVGYTGDARGEPIIAPAGSIACFASTVLHRSGANTTDRMRRVYLAQYSTEPIYLADKTTLRHLAEPVPTGHGR
ncbi:MAG TPA: phytanoyl-CoA dioxygenase family protein [Pseudonocardiaceae bacterium]|nr:phytanoyl-CoA dioxygenase family protein [Pseudonocardiaceae bacterium]